MRGLLIAKRIFHAHAFISHPAHDLFGTPCRFGRLLESPKTDRFSFYEGSYQYCFCFFFTEAIMLLCVTVMLVVLQGRSFSSRIVMFREGTEAVW